MSRHEDIMRLMNPTVIASMSVMLAAMDEAKNGDCDCSVCMQLRASLTSIEDKSDER